MRKLRRDEIVDYMTWSDARPARLDSVLAVKQARRIHFGECLTFLFENRETIRYQIQEMMRVERIVREAEIQHEIDTYNGLLGGPGELGCTLLIEIDDAARRTELLARWRPLPGHVYAHLADGRRAYATFDPTQAGEQRLSSVQYLKFPVGGEVPVAIGVSLPELQGEVPLDDVQRRALAQDLADDAGE
jgi:hypothetical protein